MESPEPHLLLPDLRLDELLSELQGRLQGVLATRDRVHALLEAVVAIGSNLQLEAVLRRIVRRRSPWSTPGTARSVSSTRTAGWPTSSRSAWTRQRSPGSTTGRKAAAGCSAC